MVSVGRLACNIALADEAVFTVPRLVIPFELTASPHHDAILITAVVVRFTRCPVRVAHRLFLDMGIGRSVAQSRSPDKLILVQGVTRSGCPNSDSMMVISAAPKCPNIETITYKQSISRLLLLTNNILHELLSSTHEDEIWDRAFCVVGPVAWNSLPAAVRHADSLHSFKRKFKSHFLA